MVRKQHDSVESRVHHQGNEAAIDARFDGQVWGCLVLKLRRVAQRLLRTERNLLGLVVDRETASTQDVHSNDCISLDTEPLSYIRKVHGQDLERLSVNRPELHARQVHAL